MSTRKHSCWIQQKIKAVATIFPFALLALSAVAFGPATAQQFDKFDNRFYVQNDPVPGGVVIVDVGDAQLEEPHVDWDYRKIAVHRQADRWLAIVGVPLETQPGYYTLSVISDESHKKVRFQVHTKNYPLQKHHETRPRRLAIKLRCQ